MATCSQCVGNNKLWYERSGVPGHHATILHILPHSYSTILFHIWLTCCCNPLQLLSAFAQPCRPCQHYHCGSDQLLHQDKPNVNLYLTKILMLAGHGAAAGCGQGCADRVQVHAA